MKVWILWEVWGDEMFLFGEERVRLDEVEEFDEWEEFVFFGSYYCVVRVRMVGERGVRLVVYFGVEILVGVVEM